MMKGCCVQFCALLFIIALPCFDAAICEYGGHCSRYEFGKKYPPVYGNKTCDICYAFKCLKTFDRYLEGAGCYDDMVAACKHIKKSEEKFTDASKHNALCYDDFVVGSSKEDREAVQKRDNVQKQRGTFGMTNYKKGPDDCTYPEGKDLTAEDVECLNNPECAKSRIPGSPQTQSDTTDSSSSIASFNLAGIITVFGWILYLLFNV